MDSRLATILGDVNIAVYSAVETLGKKYRDNDVQIVIGGYRYKLANGAIDRCDNIVVTMIARYSYENSRISEVYFLADTPEIDGSKSFGLLTVDTIADMIVQSVSNDIDAYIKKVGGKK